MLEGVQELDGISVQDDEQNRLYHEEYGSQASQEDGDRCGYGTHVVWYMI